jgi:transcriptional regulator with XRE-family HTH domain
MKPQTMNFASRDVRQASKHLGGLIRAARRARRMTQTELAIRAGTSHPTLIRIEAGSPATALGTVLSVMEQLGLLKLIGDLRDPTSEELLSKQAPQRGRSKVSTKDLNF